MSRRRIFASQYHIMYPLFLVIFLTIGIFFTIYQSEKNLQLNSHAAGMTTTNCTIPSNKIAIKTQEQQLFGLINQYRLQHNINQLNWNDTLKQAAAWQSMHMQSQHKLSHIDSLNRTPDIRLTNCGYNINNGYGEVIAEGPQNSSIIFSSWENNAPNNRILLDPKYTIAGIDMETTSSGNAYWTMDFGANATQTPSSGSQPIYQNFPRSGSFSAPTTADMKIFVSVKIYGIGKNGNPKPIHTSRKITAYVYTDKIIPVASGSGILTFNGNTFTGTIHLGKLTQGKYVVKLTANNMIQKLTIPALQTLLVNKINPIPQITLYQGDLNGDHVLNNADYNLFLACFYNLFSCSDTKAIDLNDDGKINIIDYNLLLQNIAMLHNN